MTGLQENFWDTLHPEVDEGDMEGRANAISWMDTQTTFVLKQVPITAGGYSFNDWEDSKRFDFPDNIESMDSDSQERWAELGPRPKTNAALPPRCGERRGPRPDASSAKN